MNRRDEDRTTASFLRGMTLGAIVGAIIAGSSLWARWWGRRRGQGLEGRARRSVSPHSRQ